ncbi:hypothetical protein IAU60_002650 [Kwoniella sp. DSM 27419]
MPTQPSFSFPPPGWPSNTVASPSSSDPRSTHMNKPLAYPTHSPFPASQPNLTHPYPVHPTYPAYPSYPPPLPQQQQQQHHHVNASYGAYHGQYVNPVPSPRHYPPSPYAYHPTPSGQSLPSPSSPMYAPFPFPISTHHAPPPAQLNYQIQPPHQYPHQRPSQPLQPPPSSHSRHQPVPPPPPPSHAPAAHNAHNTAPSPAAPAPTHSNNTAYPAHGTTYRSVNGSAPHPARTAQQYPPSQSYSNHRQSNGYAQTNGSSRAPPARPSVPLVYHHPSSHPPGALGFFLPPPGQPTTDPSLSTPPTSQGGYTTYYSRLRTGVTGLIQPEHVTGGPREREAFLAEQEREAALARGTGSGASTPRYDSPIPGGGGRRSAMGAVSTLSGRRGRVVNYAEKASDDEDDDDESELSELDEPPSDPEDQSFGPPPKRKPGRPRKNPDPVLVVGGPEHQAAMRAGRARKKREDMDRGWTWLGDRVPGDKVRSRRAEATAHQYPSEERLLDAADRPELIVPINVDLEVQSNDPNVQGLRVKDRFLWNVNEPFINPRAFAEMFCKDIGISAVGNADYIEGMIRSQLEDAQNTVEIDIQDEDVTEDHVQWSDGDEVENVMELDAETPAPARSSEGPGADGGDGAVEDGVEADIDRDIDVAKDTDKVWKEADCRIIVNLDVQIYTHILRDRIEWDLSSPLPPAVFAKQYCAELGLTGEAIPLVAHAIHEELLKHKKDALELDLFATTHPEQQAKFERTGMPKTNSKRGPKGLKGVWRDWVERQEFGPTLVELSFEEISARDQEAMREARRMKRATAGNKRRRN